MQNRNHMSVWPHVRLSVLSFQSLLELLPKYWSPRAVRPRSFSSRTASPPPYFSLHSNIMSLSRTFSRVPSPLSVSMWRSLVWLLQPLYLPATTGSLPHPISAHINLLYHRHDSHPFPLPWTVNQSVHSQVSQQLFQSLRKALDCPY